MLLLISTYEPRKKNSCFPFKWLFKRDHYNGRLYHISWWYHTLYNRTNQGFSLLIHTYIYIYMCKYVYIHQKQVRLIPSFTALHLKKSFKNDTLVLQLKLFKGYPPPDFQNRYPEKGVFERIYISKKTFLVSMLDFGVVHVIFLWGSVAFTSRQYIKSSSKFQSKMKKK